MTALEIFAVPSLTAFIEVATYFIDGVVFRGQPEDWPLVPSIGRMMNQTSLVGREQAILEGFKRESLPYLDWRPDNDWRWLAVAQHNRLPTRLLDWTRSPLAALSTLRYQLFRVGISPASLFPGLPGLVDRIRYDNIRCDDELERPC